MLTPITHNLITRLLNLLSALICTLLLLMPPLLNAHTGVGPPPILPEGPPSPPPPPCKTGQQCCDKAGGGGKIVYMSGEETFRRTDLVVKDVYPIKVARTYSSNTRCRFRY